MRLEFIKMHGLGNDFVVLDGRNKKLPHLSSQNIVNISNRNNGIGCDQVIILERSKNTDAEFCMRIFNADGSEVEACGNAARSVAVLHGKPANIETIGGIISIEPSQRTATVHMGFPNFEWDAIPLSYAMDTASLPVGWENLENPCAVNIGNPHLVFFTDDCFSIDLSTIGPKIENDPIFPEKINVNVATIVSRNLIRLRVWERGVGLTKACGTGACATAVAAMRRDLVDRKVTVELPGGALEVRWPNNESVQMSGPACESFRGSFDLSYFGENFR
jgi:diaminopimelate epimerase